MTTTKPAKQTDATRFIYRYHVEIGEWLELAAASAEEARAEAKRLFEQHHAEGKLQVITAGPHSISCSVCGHDWTETLRTHNMTFTSQTCSACWTDWATYAEELRGGGR